MRNFKFTLLGIIFTLIMGTLLHFTYEWSGENPIVGLFSAVNESTWEHLKLLFFPFIIWAFIELFLFGKDVENFFYGKAKGVIAGMLFIILGFYAYTTLLGKNIFWIDISLFIISVLIAFFIDWRTRKKEHCPFKNCNTLSLIIICLITILFFIFTYYPPDIFLFQSPE